MVTRVVSLLYLLLVSAICFSTNYPEKSEIFEALNKVFNFLEREPHLNVDGLFGIVFAEAMLESTINEGQDVLEKKKLIVLKEKALKIIEFIKPTLISKPHKYKMFNDNLLDPQLWMKNITFTFDELYPHSISNNPNQFSSDIEFLHYMENSTFSEDKSDKCIVELLEQTQEIESSNSCKISEQCAEYMIVNKHHDPGYGVTHRLLFLQIARARKCIIDKDELKKITRRYCSYILWEAEKIFMIGLSHYFIDLLMEQVFVCGYEGYGEFLSRKWLPFIMKSQKAAGCFTDNVHSRREKREAHLIGDSCVDHTTGLGAATLSLYLNFILQNKLLY